MPPAGTPRAFICAPNCSENPFRTTNVPVGVILVWPDGNWDWEFETLDDQFHVLTVLEGVNWQNPEVADYIRERMDRPQSCAFWEVEVRPGDTTKSIFKRIMDIKKGLAGNG